MKIENPVMLNFLWLIPLVIGIYVFTHKIYAKRLKLFVKEGLQDHLIKKMSYRNIYLKKILTLTAVFLSVVALARPQWGFEWRDIKKEGLDIIVAIDTSRSMLTSDVLPNRLKRTKFAVQDLVKNLKGDRIGLMAFAGDAFLVCPLTNDYNGFLLSLNDLSVDTIPRGGTNIESAITQTIKAYDGAEGKNRVLILVTDGDNLEGNPLELVEKAKGKDIRIYTVGVGTREGELIKVRNEDGSEDFVRNQEGNVVISKLNESLLDEIARLSNGIYIKATGAQFGLDYIYNNELSKLEKSEFKATKEKKYYERFQIPLSLAIILLMFEVCLPRVQSK